jgi:V8-like Glu-specific endopeptidase
VEYYEPVAVRGQGRIRLTKAIHGYRWVGGIASDPCEVDVNCSEGAGWEAQRDAVVRIRVVVGAGSGWCSGALVNNTAQDCKPYVLSAMHCILGSTAANFNQYQFRFRYQRNCGSGTAPTNFNITGCVKRADSNDNGGDNGSDFVLLELNSAPPATMTPYWAGWNAGTTAATSGKGIHHPAADVKKISTYTSNLTNAGWGALNTHWRVTWVATTNGHGVTEGGSSGSPIFDQNKRIVGTLTGGGSCCTVNGCGSNTGPNVPDFYGKMSYHWTLNPNSASQKLKVWLDPANTGATVLDGSYNPCGSAGLAELERASSPLVFPNPGRDRVTVRFPEGVAMADRLEVTDVSGRTVLSERPPMPGTAVIDVAGWAPGSYLVTVVAAGVRHAAARFLVEGR